MPLLEKSIFLRTLNFLRIQHPHRAQYCYIYPATITAFVLAASIYSNWGHPSPSLTERMQPILSSVLILFPFFLASLAAVSTFQGPKGFDSEFKMRTPVVLSVTYRGGLRQIPVSYRYFLCLLLGYCASISLFIFVALSLESAIPLSRIIKSSDILDLLMVAFSAINCFLFFQILILTMVAIYYLSDLIHRLDKRE